MIFTQYYILYFNTRYITQIIINMQVTYDTLFHYSKRYLYSFFKISTIVLPIEVDGITAAVDKIDLFYRNKMCWINFKTVVDYMVDIALFVLAYRDEYRQVESPIYITKSQISSHAFKLCAI